MDAVVQRLLRTVERPLDETAFEERSRAVDEFVATIARRVGPQRVKRQGPEDIFAFFDVAVAANSFEVAPVLRGGFDTLSAVSAAGKEPTVVRVLLGLQHDGALLFWQRFVDGDGWREHTTTDPSPQSADEAVTVSIVRDALAHAGWVVLDPAVIEERVPGMVAVHPAPQPPRVRDVLFPASAGRID